MQRFNTKEKKKSAHLRVGPGDMENTLDVLVLARAN